MTSKNIAKLNKLLADYLQWLYYKYCLACQQHGEEIQKLHWYMYEAVYTLIERIGGDWKRHYHGDDTEEQKLDIQYYSHWVLLPSDKTLEGIDDDIWEI